MMAKSGYLFFLTAVIGGVLAVLILFGKDMTQLQQDMLSGTVGGLMMALQSCVHSIYQVNGNGSNPTKPGNPAGDH